MGLSHNHILSESFLEKTNLCTNATAQRNSHPLAPLAIVSTFHALECLHQPYRRIASLEERILLPDTDARSTIEGKVFPITTSQQSTSNG
jgi:hypothetical protein